MRLTLTARKQETADVVSFRFGAPALKTWKPGQYLHYTLPHAAPDDRGAERWFSIASAPFEGFVQLTTRFSPKSSSFKTALRGLEVGGTIEADGLEGDFTVEDPKRRLVFIAGGVGITPYRAILLALDRASAPIDVDLLYANRDEAFPFRDELEDLASKNRGLRLRWFAGSNKLDDPALRAAVGDLAGPVFYVSGPQPMVEAFAARLKAMAIPESRIKTDDFPGYEWP